MQAKGICGTSVWFSLQNPVTDVFHAKTLLLVVTFLVFVHVFFVQIYVFFVWQPMICANKQAIATLLPVSYSIPLLSL